MIAIAGDVDVQFPQYGQHMLACEDRSLQRRREDIPAEDGVCIGIPPPIGLEECHEACDLLLV